MSIAGRTLSLVALLIAAVVFQVAWGAAMQIGPARPNLALVAMLVISLFGNTTQGVAFGFLSGILEASYSARFFGSMIVTRSLTGLAAGALEESIFRDSPFVALLVVSGGTFVAEVLLYLFAPQPFLRHWAIRVSFEVIYNGILAIPVYLLFRKLIRWKRDVWSR